MPGIYVSDTGKTDMTEIGIHAKSQPSLDWIEIFYCLVERDTKVEVLRAMILWFFDISVVTEINNCLNLEFRCGNFWEFWLNLEFSYGNSGNFDWILNSVTLISDNLVTEIPILSEFEIQTF